MKLIIAGAGGHGKVACDVAMATNQWSEIYFVDDRYPELEMVLGKKVIGRFDDLEHLNKNKDFCIIVAIGNNPKRLSLIKHLLELGYECPVLIHPSAVVSQYAIIDHGSVIFPNVVINANAKIGIGAIINTGAVIEHDCVLGEGVHISPNAGLAGGAKVGNGSWIGINACVIEQVIIGNHVIVGAGSVAIENVADNQKIVGVPGRAI